MNKYEKYINYIVNDIQPPYIKNMEEMYGLKPEEYKLVLSRIFDQPIRIEGELIYDQYGNEIYYENSDGYWIKTTHEYKQNGGKIVYREQSGGHWIKKEYDSTDNVIYFEDSDGYWFKQEFDTNDNRIYYEKSDGYWEKNEYDTNGNVIYSEDSDGAIDDYR